MSMRGLLFDQTRAVIMTVSSSSSRVSPMITSVWAEIWLVPATKVTEFVKQASVGARQRKRSPLITADPLYVSTIKRSPVGAFSLRVTVIEILVKPESPSVILVLVVDRVMVLVGAGVLVGVLPWACRGGGAAAEGSSSSRTPASSRTAARGRLSQGSGSAAAESRRFLPRPEIRGGGG